MWAVGELRLFSPEGELQRSEKWRLRASVNPWEVQRAFDNCPISRWVSAEPARIGQYVEVEFDQPVELVGVRVEALMSTAPNVSTSSAGDRVRNQRN